MAAVVAGSLVAGLGLGAWLFRSRGAAAPESAARAGSEAVAAAGATEVETAVGASEAKTAAGAAEVETAASRSGLPAAASGDLPPDGRTSRNAAEHLGPVAAEAPAGAAPEPTVTASGGASAPGTAQPGPPAGTRVPTASSPAPGPGLEVRPSPPAPAPVAPSAAGSLPPEAAPAAAPEEPVFFRRAVLPDGTTLSLHGIAFSEERPTALINGEVLAPGESVAGYTVIEILADRVRLRGAAGTLALRLK